MSKARDIVEKNKKSSKKADLQFYSPAGSRVRSRYVWNETRDHLVEVEKIDCVAEMNERAKGTSIVEQIARLERGDTSVIDPSRVTAEDFETDVSGMPESAIEIVDQGVQAKATIIKLKAQEEAIAKQDEELKALQAQIAALKADLNKPVEKEAE